MNPRPTIALLLALFLAVAARADLCAVRDLELVPDDPTVDNGAILTAAIRDGRVNDGIDFPGGAYYATSTVDDRSKEGLAFTGQGLTHWNVPGAYRHPTTGQPQRRGNASVRWIYRGPAEQPAWRISGYGTRIQGINIWRGSPGKAKLLAQWGSDEAPSTGIEFVKGGGPPAGKWSVDHVSFAGFGRAVHFADSTNVDSSDFGYLRFVHCRTCIDADNMQTTCLGFGHVAVYGRGETVFDVSAGGNFQVGILELIGPRLIWLFRRTGSNVSTFQVMHTKIDNNAAGWRLVEQTGPGPLWLRMPFGEIGNKATPGERPIVTRDYMGRAPRIDVDLVGDDKLKAN